MRLRSMDIDDDHPAFLVVERNSSKCQNDYLTGLGDDASILPAVTIGIPMERSPCAGERGQNLQCRRRVERFNRPDRPA